MAFTVDTWAPQRQQAVLKFHFHLFAKFYIFLVPNVLKTVRVYAYMYENKRNFFQIEL